MKEEFTHAKRARETGEGRVAPGIEPFYQRMLEFINGRFDNISPHSTIVRRSSSISSNNTTNNPAVTNNGHNSSSSNSTINVSDNGIANVDSNNINNGQASSTTPTNISRISHAASRASARIAANSNGISTNDIGDTNSTIVTRQTNLSVSEYQTNGSTPLDSRPASRQNPRLSSPSNPVSINNNGNHVNNYSKSQAAPSLNGVGNHNQQHHDEARSTKPITHDSSYSNHVHDSPSSLNNMTNNSLLNNSNEFTNHLQHPERDADISYRVSTGCRQIIIFGDHDVDIKFRGDCVTINKISSEFSNPTATVSNSDT